MTTFRVYDHKTHCYLFQYKGDHCYFFQYKGEWSPGINDVLYYGDRMFKCKPAAFFVETPDEIELLVKEINP